MKPQWLKVSPQCDKKAVQGKEGGGIMKENYVKEDFPQQSFAMLMFTGQKPEQLLANFMPGTENKLYCWAKSPAHLHEELLAP